MQDDETFEFAPRYEIGDARIDAEHRHLFSIARRVQAALSLPADAALAEARLAVAELLDYTRTHFAGEEVMMAATGYPDLVGHQALHRELLYQVRDMEMRIDLEGLSASLDLAHFLFNWLTQHILHADRRFGEFLADSR
ncbi:bacteriohemerythrin [Rhodocyclus tenuis]|uniref:Bacteriohemerythrin n=1 Tax=Rhodocyclus tenuis TaxID=1066 RepID=A0A6L5JZD5_RHOTE|nr:bacteriohemerythrin [Rhodocyclus gracilis]MQY52663.1 bacteriohemerythrin [Rhodocyclus gracilis]MRD73355.1 bacteriohemerythrin [Rhodocyclus gracilis]